MPSCSSNHCATFYVLFLFFNFNLVQLLQNIWVFPHCRQTDPPPKMAPPCQMIGLGPRTKNHPGYRGLRPLVPKLQRFESRKKTQKNFLKIFFFQFFFTFQAILSILNDFWSKKFFGQKKIFWDLENFSKNFLKNFFFKKKFFPDVLGHSKQKKFFLVKKIFSGTQSFFDIRGTRV